jgi:hypothetical protein
MPLHVAAITILPPRHTSSDFPSGVQLPLPSFEAVHDAPAFSVPLSQVAPFAFETQPCWPLQSSILA